MACSRCLDISESNWRRISRAVEVRSVHIAEGCTHQHVCPSIERARVSWKHANARRTLRTNETNEERIRKKKMAGQIIQRGDKTWLVRVYTGQDPATSKRTYHNHTVHGNKKAAQKYLNGVLRERDLGRFETAEKTM